MTDCYNHAENHEYKNINREHRKPLILKKVKSLNAEIVCLQDVQKSHLVKEDFPDYNLFFKKKITTCNC